MNKKIILSAVLAVSLLATAGMALAKKPEGIKPGTQKIDWNLSGAVMPVPLYGSGDIIGSDTASKLKVNSDKDSVKGKMKGLTPNTTYTVFISNPWTPYVCTGWNVTGAWDLSFVAESGAIGTYSHHMDVTQASNGTLTGTGYYIPAPSYTWVIDPGSYVSGNDVVIKLHFTAGHPSDWASTFTGTIDSSGKLTGTWIDTGVPVSSGTITTLLGQALKNCTGTTGWTGLLTPTIQPFTFTTNDKGDGKWKVKIKDSDVEKPADFSVWINEGGATILISDNATLEVGKVKKVK